jgi:hypothetical protein
VDIIEKIKRKFGWVPVSERKYHNSFDTCIHHWNWDKFGQCPECARGAMSEINWSLIKEDDLPRLKGIIDASRR